MRIVLRDKSIESEPRANQCLHVESSSKLRNRIRLTGEKCGGIADIENTGMNSCGFDCDQRVVETGELIFSHTAVGFVGCEQVCHDSLEAKREITAKAREQRRKSIQLHSLTAHTRVDLQVNGD